MAAAGGGGHGSRLEGGRLRRLFVSHTQGKEDGRVSIIPLGALAVA